MAMVSDQAICIRIVEYSETSQIATIFSRRRGLVRVIAKGAHRTTKAGSSRFDGGLDLLDEAAALLGDRAERDLNILAEWKIIDGHRGLRRSRRSLHLGLLLAELLNELFEAMDPHPDLFDRFSRTLAQLGTPATEEAALAMLLDLLRHAGYLPELSSCAVCGSAVAGERMLYFSPKQGGVVCRNCEAGTPERMPVDPRLIGIALTVQRLPRDKGIAMRLPRLTRAQTDPLMRIVVAHVEQVIGKPLRLRRHVLPSRGAEGTRIVTNRTNRHESNTDARGQADVQSITSSIRVNS